MVSALIIHLPPPRRCQESFHFSAFNPEIHLDRKLVDKRVFPHRHQHERHP